MPKLSHLLVSLSMTHVVEQDQVASWFSRERLTVRIFALNFWMHPVLLHAPRNGCCPLDVKFTSDAGDVLSFTNAMLRHARAKELKSNADCWKVLTQHGRTMQTLKQEAAARAKELRVNPRSIKEWQALGDGDLAKIRRLGANADQPGPAHASLPEPGGVRAAPLVAKKRARDGRKAADESEADASVSGGESETDESPQESDHSGDDNDEISNSQASSDAETEETENATRKRRQVRISRIVLVHYSIEM